ncbi:hypothetical protein [Sphingomonas kyungheensis]|uniref:EF-hand domain-containing protein n=1 Tax=Sphingomonas kyungheensis TaxID=1069987 RepID=A0ABU8H1D2_9SPHN
MIRRTLAAMMAAGMIAGAAGAQTPPPPPPPPGAGGGMMRLDADHDGVITRAEMLAEADARFTAMDTNKDGTVTPDEREAARAAMRAQWRGRDRRAGDAPPPPRDGARPPREGAEAMTRAQALDHAGRRFDRLDTNHDGRLDAAELAAARPMRGPRDNGMPPAPPEQ